MVSVAYQSRQSDVPLDAPSWLKSLPFDAASDEYGLLARAVKFAAELYADARLPIGEMVIDHAIGTAALLGGLRLDHESLAAAILFAAPDYLPDSAKALEEKFGSTISGLVDGVARMSQIEALNDIAHPRPEDRHAQAEALRKMLLAMVEDIRVVLIKLGERTYTMRYLTSRDETLRRETAKQVLDIYAPLANRLGVWEVKWELEDLAFRATEPVLYKKIATLLDERRLDREQFITAVIMHLKTELVSANVEADITGRPKHIYSIYKKMRRKHVDFDEVYDVRAVRILVDDVKDCYTALGIVHNLWQPIPKEFDDYIAKPKGNDYRSLHTAVIGPEGKALEVQIRTMDMHRHSEFGVAAHWRYKEGSKNDAAYDDKIAWLRQILEWKNDVADSGDLMHQFKTGLFEDVVYVLTPQGKVIDMPKGSTPVDFAYHVHTNLGHRCRGAKVNGNMVPLNYPLQNGQRVEIVAAKQGGPSRDWLNPHLGYLHSPRAKAKVRQWFHSLQLEETVAQGRMIVERELQREGATAINLEELAAKFGMAKLEEFFATVARGDINTRDLQMAFRVEPQIDAMDDTALLLPRKSRANEGNSGILVVGVDKLLTGLAKCCKPAPPDPIIGFVTRGKGVSIHRQSCSNLTRLKLRSGERLITADWGLQKGDIFPVDIEVEALDRQGLLRDISEVLSRDKLNVTAVKTASKQHQARMYFTVEITDLEQLRRTMALIKDVSGVLRVGRR